MLAGAPRDSSWLRDLHFAGAETGSGMRSIAEWLTRRTATGAPPICAGFDFLNDWFFLKNYRFFHSGWRLSGEGCPENIQLEGVTKIKSFRDCKQKSVGNFDGKGYGKYACLGNFRVFLGFPEVPNPGTQQC